MLLRGFCVVGCSSVLVAFSLVSCARDTGGGGNLADAATGMDTAVVTNDSSTNTQDRGARPPVCTTSGPENTADTCADGCDNNSDGFADCNDFDCCNAVTCGTGTACARRDASTPRDSSAARCPGAPTAENTVTACSDGCSNDDDNFVDCFEFSCCGLVTCGAGTSCFGRDASTPAGNRCPGAETAENTVEACSDGCSNDGDNFVDCDEFSCCGLVACGAGTACFGRDASVPRDSGARCMGDAGAENTVEACSDGCSNDNDTFVDCDEFDCCGLVACGAGTSCFGRDAGARDN